MKSTAAAWVLALAATLACPAQAEELPFAALILDPGHGGATDPGLSSTEGRKEKDLALALATDLAKRLSKERPGVRPILTRSEDAAKTQEARSNLANTFRPAFFVSLHFTAAANPSRSAIHVFYAPPLAPESVPAPDSRPRLFQPTSRAGDAYSSESKRLAEALCQRLSAFTPAPCNGVEGAPLQMLKGLNMPSVLVEAGYLSNPPWAEVLADKREPGYSDLLRALSEGLGDFIQGTARRN
jgi:N-acetylmuramoyl-L-alanine amidase